MVEYRFEELKSHISFLIDSDLLTPEAILFKFFTPEELLLNGFLYKCIYDLNDENDPFSAYQIWKFIDEYSCNITIREDTSEMCYAELISQSTIRAVMRYLELELYNFLKNKRMEKDYCKNKHIWSLMPERDSYLDDIPNY
ncbi:MAG: hypothetical protein N2490_07605 [Ignavibacteria bacterium]|nr:hypothetical protein [Ignavibacteria bacterium]